ncbi:MAG: LysE family translocator [Gammaproteobacteria bacterium]|nr:LysE family translocator [Gammaproteobacteria bacterium]MDE0247303.1 LysE family translocator [Gammaproteobacteria bacterium]
MLTLAAAFLPFAFAAGFTPGPNNLLLAASGANFGIRRTIPHVLGIVSGFPLLVLAVGLGLGTVFQRHPEVHTTLKFVGGAFLVYLAWRIATAGHGTTGVARGRPMTFVEAVLFQWVNPKAWIFAVTAVATYTTVGGRAAAEIAVILAISLLVTIGSTVTWTGFGFWLSRFLQESPRMLRVFNVGMALLLVLSIVPVMT